MKKAFTLIELLVAMAVLAMMIAFASMVFKVSIDTYRVSAATTEIMQKLRAVTDQLDSDFKGLRRDAPLLIWFQKDTGINDPNRYDQIMFFADGDFSSIQLYNSGTKIPDADNGKVVIRGNTARIFYSQAKVNNVDPWDQKGRDERKRILAKRQHILAPEDPNVITWPNINLSDLSSPDPDPLSKQTREDRYEHDILSLAEWKTIDWSLYGGGASVIDKTFKDRAMINTGNPTTFHKLLCEGLGSFAIQWPYWDTINGKAAFYWFPSDDPDGNGSNSDSQFLSFSSDRFGVVFNVPNASQSGQWYPVSNPAFNNKIDGGYPKALKFTFTLYDSRGVIKDGMVFSHIVYLGQ